jgi:hypothetical protein
MDLRHACALALIALVPSLGLTAESAAVDAPVDRARAYLQGWKRALAAVVAEERYSQTLERFPHGRFVASTENTTSTRQLVSDILLVRAADEVDAYSLEARYAEVLKAEAQYSNHRVFQTSGRIIGEAQP